jgi:protein translocase SecG subunit
LTLPPNFSFDTTPHSALALKAPWLTHTFAGLFVIAGLLLIVLLAIQTTKQEGLSGTLGGRVESSTRRLGLDAQIARVTGTIAIAFVVVATIISLSGI